MPKGYMHQFDLGTQEIDFPDDPISAANLAVQLLDEWNGNSLNYPSVVSEAEHLEELEEDDDFFQEPTERTP